MPDNKQYKPEFSEADHEVSFPSQNQKLKIMFELKFLLQNTFAKLDFIAEDKDEADTSNSKLLYSILNIKPGKLIYSTYLSLNLTFSIMIPCSKRLQFEC